MLKTGIPTPPTLQSNLHPAKRTPPKLSSQPTLGAKRPPPPPPAEDATPVPKKAKVLEAQGPGAAAGGFDDVSTVFVKGLSPKTHEGDVRKLLQDCPGLLEVRLVRDADGKLRGFGYVEFQGEAGVEAAE